MGKFAGKDMVKIGLALAMAAALAIAMSAGVKKPPKMSYADFRAMLSQGEVETAYIAEQEIFFAVKGGGDHVTDNPQTDAIREEILLSGVRISPKGEYAGNQNAQAACLFALLGGCAAYAVGKKPTEVGKSRISVGELQTGVGIDFTCVAGQEEAINGLKDVVRFLQKPDSYAKIGARMPRGILLYGPPGTGKTLIARALAGEAGVPFFSASGSDFVQMYVGVGAKRVRELFSKAKEAGGGVIFIDEIDAIGKKRSGGQDSERDQTLNALLTRLSGFDESSGIVVLAATNRIDSLDEALLRPGRFDRHIHVGLPDRPARERILSVLASKMAVSAQADIAEWASRTTGFSGAALESMLNEAAIYAVREGGAEITGAHIERAYIATAAGEDRSEYHVDERDREICAVHESGHAIAAHRLLPDEPIKRASIIPSTKGAGGYVLRECAERMATRDYLRRQITVLYAGRAAEELFFGEGGVSTGASNDISKATDIINSMVARYGMDETAGLLAHDRLTDGLQAAAQRLSAALYGEALELLTRERGAVSLLSKELLRRESLSGDDILQLLAQ